MTPQAKDTLVQALVDTLSPTWDKALIEAYQIKQDIVSRAEQNSKSEEIISAEGLQKYKDEAVRCEKACKDVAPSTSTKAPAPKNAKEKY